MPVSLETLPVVHEQSQKADLSKPPRIWWVLLVVLGIVGLVLWLGPFTELGF